MKINSQLKQVQNVELEIMDVIHKICVENNLRYSLAYGTLLGAIRHKGFIPWDDDIDICMPREDYEKFIKIWPQYNFSDYILQNIDTDEDFTQTFTKIRKNHTTFLQHNEENLRYHKGIFVDIFPGDRVPNTNFKRKIQFICFAINLLFSRKHRSKSNNKIISIIEIILLMLPKSQYSTYRKLTKKQVTKYNSNSSLSYVFGCTIDAVCSYFPADLFKELILVDFEGKSYYAFKDFDKYLRIRYGDYMKLPPEEERVWKHNPIIIDFEKNYEDLQGV